MIAVEQLIMASASSNARPRLMPLVIQMAGRAKVLVNVQREAQAEIGRKRGKKAQWKGRIIPPVLQVLLLKR